MGVAGQGCRAHICRMKILVLLLSLIALPLSAQQVPVLTGTLGKAFGCSGAFIAGSKALIDHLVNEARSYIYTTAMPPAVAAAARSALHRVIEDDWRREHLQMLIAHFKREAANRGLSLLDSNSPIQPMIIGDSRATLELAGELKQRGFLVVAIRPPTVQQGTARLRITLTCGHQSDQLDGLLDAIEAAIKHE